MIMLCMIFLPYNLNVDSCMLFEFLLNHLRIKQPISWQRFSARTGMSADTLKTLFTEQVAEDCQCRPYLVAADVPFRW